MKTRIISILCLLAAIMPLQSTAQTNIRKAFDKLLKSSDVSYTESHSMEKDATTGIKESQSDVYNFTLPAGKISLVDNVVKAFKSDENLAYSINSGIAGNGDRTLSLAVGDGTDGVTVNTPGRNYIYACFIAPEKENPSGNYRYAYAINWVEKDGQIKGKLIITYATTLKYRQQQSNRSSFRIINGTYVGNIDQAADTDSWFGKFMGYVQAMSTKNLKTRQALATRLYEHTKLAQSTSDMTNEDKNTAREILKGMISDKRYEDTVIQRLLNASLVNLK